LCYIRQKVEHHSKKNLDLCQAAGDSLEDTLKILDDYLDSSKKVLGEFERLEFRKRGAFTTMNKSTFTAQITSIQLRKRLTWSFDEASHTYRYLGKEVKSWQRIQIIY